jgi:hypothetical protein
MVAMLAGFSAQAYASHITAYPSSVRLSTSGQYYIVISDGRDTNTFPQTPLTLATLSISGSSEWTLASSASISFFGSTYVTVQYTPTGSAQSRAVLTITGDSNTATVALIGTPPNHRNLSIYAANFYNLKPNNRDSCEPVWVINPNSFSVSVTSIVVSSPGVQYHLANLPSLAHTMRAYDTMMFDLCVLDSQVSDTGLLQASVQVNYTFSGGADSVSQYVYANFIPLDSTCLSISGTDVGSAEDGTSVSKTFSLANHTNASVTVDSAKWLYGNITGEFSITSPTFPVTIAAHSTHSVSVQFSASSNAAEGSYFGGLAFWDRGTSADSLPCGSLYVGFTGSVFIPVADTTILNVPADSTASIGLTASTMISRHAFIIHNAGSSRIQLSSLAITSNDSIASFTNSGSTAYMYDSLAVGAYSQPVIMTLDVATLGTYTIDLLLNYRNALQSQKYTVTVHRVPSGNASVRNPAAPAASEFTMNPNPARGEVTITLPVKGNSTVEIYDVLGNLLLRKQAAGQFVWNGLSANEGAAASGSYIVRVVERHADGTTASSAKRLVFVR